ncbi:helix-turn-helix transcriptional regulator [Streptomyces sp. B6B3]|uniref:helix-turn-helix domain-containing protein n=1 Tax=Streptomyces sp. B6B3 TaxID=3153570 RepID=UPI00325D2266
MALKRSRVPQSVHRRQLAVRFRELREASGMTLTEVAGRIEVNQGSLSRIENGERGVSAVLARALMDCFGVDDAARRDELLDLVRVDKEQQRPWWRRYASVLTSTRYDGYLAWEAGAAALNSYQPMLVPGLLQTEDYARAVIGQMRSELGSAEVDDLVTVRMKRQHDRLDGERPATLWALLDEAVLHRTIGSRQVMADQARRLLAASEKPNVTVQILPFALGAHPGLYGPFVILSFPDTTPDLVWLENPKNSGYLDAEADVQDYRAIFDQLCVCALSPSETRTRISQMTEEFHP